ncbi:unnamed protein product, partial [Staurois parvus]
MSLVLWSEYKARSGISAYMSEYWARRSAVLPCRALPVPRSRAAQSSRACFCDSRPSPDIPCTVCSPPPSGLRSSAQVIPPALSAVSGHPLHCPAVSGHPCTVCSLRSSPALSAVSGHSLHTVCSLRSFPALSAVSGHSLHCLQSPVIDCTVCTPVSTALSAVSGHRL